MVSNNTIHLQVGDVCIAFHYQDEEVYRRLSQFYKVFLTEGEPDITVELEATERVNPKDLKKVFSRTKYTHKEDKKGKRFFTSTGLIAGQYDLARRFIKITGEKSLADPGSELNLLNRLISLSYYSASQLKFGNTPPAMLVHACGILRNGKAIIFTGASGAGKSTVGSLCREQDGEVINDEILLVSRPDKDVIVQSAPILGDFTPKRKITAPLSYIVFIKQSDKTVARRIARTDAYLRLMRQIITPAYIGQSNKRAILTLIADFSNELTAAIPSYELEFTLDKESFWRTVGDIDIISGQKEPSQ